MNMHISIILFCTYFVSCTDSVMGEMTLRVVAATGDAAINQPSPSQFTFRSGHKLVISPKGEAIFSAHAIDLNGSGYLPGLWKEQPESRTLELIHYAGTTGRASKRIRHGLREYEWISTTRPLFAAEDGSIYAFCIIGYAPPGKDPKYYDKGIWRFSDQALFCIARTSVNRKIEARPISFKEMAIENVSPTGAAVIRCKVASRFSYYLLTHQYGFQCIVADRQPVPIVNAASFVQSVIAIESDGVNNLMVEANVTGSAHTSTGIMFFQFRAETGQLQLASNVRPGRRNWASTSRISRAGHLGRKPTIVPEIRSHPFISDEALKNAFARSSRRQTSKLGASYAAEGGPVIVSVGDPTPGVPGGKFVRLKYLGCTSDRRTLFLGDFERLGEPQPSSGIWVHEPSLGVSLVAVEGALAPGATDHAFFTGFTDGNHDSPIVHFFRTGNALVFANIDGGQGSGCGLWMLQPNNSLVPVVADHSSIRDTQEAHWRISRWRDPTCMDDGLNAYVAFTITEVNSERDMVVVVTNTPGD